MKLLDELVAEAAKWVGVQETTPNAGAEVQMFQKYVDGIANKEAWCCCFVQYCLGQVETINKIRTRIFKTEHVMTMWNNTHRSLRVPTPHPGYIAVWNVTGTSKGHTGIITKVIDEKSFETIEGNTSPSIEVQREGDGVYRKTRLLVSTGPLKIVGFLNPFANLLKDGNVQDS